MPGRGRDRLGACSLKIGFRIVTGPIPQRGKAVQGRELGEAEFFVSACARLVHVWFWGRIRAEASKRFAKVLTVRACVQGLTLEASS
jgi:hypothetical protein